MIKMLAISEGDGMAFVKADGIIFFVSPPYRKDNKTQVEETVVANAINKQGYISSNEEFQDWSVLIHHLKTKFRAVWDTRELSLSKSDALRMIISEATKETIKGFLDRVEREFIPEGKLEHAIQVLNDIGSAAAVKSDADLMCRTLGLHALIQTEKQKVRSDSFTALINEKRLEDQFPLVAKQYGAQGIAKISKEIAKDGLYKTAA